MSGFSERVSLPALAMLGGLAFVQQASAQDYVCTDTGESVLAECKTSDAYYGWIGHAVRGSNNDSYLGIKVASVSGCNVRCDVSAEYTDGHPTFSSRLSPGHYLEPAWSVPTNMSISCFCE
jgi:hypothetical protein